MNTQKQLELLLLRSNNFNNSDFELVNPNSNYLPSQDPYLFSKKYDMVIGYDDVYVVTKEGFNLGVFTSQREVINFISNIIK